MVILSEVLEVKIFTYFLEMCMKLVPAFGYALKSHSEVLWLYPHSQRIIFHLTSVCFILLNFKWQYLSLWTDATNKDSINMTFLTHWRNYEYFNVIIFKAYVFFNSTSFIWVKKWFSSNQVRFLGEWKSRPDSEYQ